MEDVIVTIIFSLSVFLTFPVAAIGVIKHSCKLLVAASILSLPFSLYVSGGDSLIDFIGNNVMSIPDRQTTKLSSKCGKSEIG